MPQVGEGIPFRSLGHATLDSLLSSLPDVCSVQRRGAQLAVTGVASRSTAHVMEMVSRQSGKKGGRAAGGGGGGRQGGWGGGSRGVELRGRERARSQVREVQEDTPPTWPPR